MLQVRIEIRFRQSSCLRSSCLTLRLVLETSPRMLSEKVLPELKIAKSVILWKRKCAYPTVYISKSCRDLTAPLTDYLDSRRTLWAIVSSRMAYIARRLIALDEAPARRLNKIDRSITQDGDGRISAVFA